MLDVIANLLLMNCRCFRMCQILIQSNEKILYQIKQKKCKVISMCKCFEGKNNEMFVTSCFDFD